MKAKIRIRGAIVPNNHKWIYDYFEMDATCPRDIETQLEAAKGGEVEVEINSPGGDVFSGADIYTKLKAYEGKTIGKIIGVAPAQQVLLQWELMNCTFLRQHRS